MRKHRAFTLTEVLVAVAVMSIMAGVMALNSATVGKQTAKREAERVAAFIQGHINKSNIAMHGLWFVVNQNNIQVWYGFSSQQQEKPQLNANQGCVYTIENAKLCYRTKSVPSGWNAIEDDSTAVTDSVENGQHIITIEGADKKYSNVIIGRKL